MTDINTPLTEAQAREMHQWQDIAKRLRFVDGEDVAWMTPSDWFMFRNNPTEFLARCDDETAARIWRIVEGKAES